MKYLLGLVLAIVVMSATSAPAKAAWVVAYDAGYHQWYVVQTDAFGNEVEPYYWYDTYPYAIAGFYPRNYYVGPRYYHRCPHVHHNWHNGGNHGGNHPHNGGGHHDGNHNGGNHNGGGNHGGNHGGQHGGGGNHGGHGGNHGGGHGGHGGNGGGHGGHGGHGK